MLPYFTELYGNPSSVYEFSAPVKEAVTRAREVIGASIEREKRIFILLPAAQRQITGPLRLQQMLTDKRESTSLPVKLSIMQCCTPVSIWSRRALR